ncbi:Signal transduction histidine-protein kinase/phosphatase DegS [Meiothermus luteus]|uniref:Oxygen sensor histidine kinase NreB n=1 Tax=Meiothermus luteus TaxID=2026184 RepID=A0A399EWG1_9DEIN|nr:sensor histidine kinase [Meiothermus luteus]RIH88023.1 Signal transduction histidine-protein kinase/phosphatase DegS [Meiothermus luteus]RMH56852.1 MAG: sensor histidine kinase [Deinococcota bacterium]
MEAVPSLYRLIRLYRLFLPVAIVLVVVLFEVSLQPYEGLPVAFWLRLGFYGLVGPLVTWMTLEWIAQQVQEREEVQRALEEANRRLMAVGNILRRASVADNLEQALAAVVQEVAQALRREAALTLEGVRAASAGFTPGRVYEVALPGLEGRLEVAVESPLSKDEQSFLEVLAAEVAGALEAVRSRSRDLLTLYEVDQALRAEANLERLLERLLDRILEWAKASGGGVLLLDEENFLQPQVMRHLELPLRAFPPQGLWKEALEAPVFVEDDLLAVPLREKDVVGLLLLRGEAENLRQRLPFLRFLAAQVTLAVRNAQAYLRAEELALTEERNRIAREIHDGVAQALAFMALKLDLVERLWPTDPKRAIEELQQVKDTLRAQIREVRRSIFALRPIDLERYGFLESVRRYAQAFAEQAGFRLRLSLPERIGLSQASELVLFRVLQEALANAAKHGRPSLVQVSLAPLGERGGVLEIRDNGRGFRADGAPEGMGGFGLTQMRERVEARGGRFSVESVQGQGTLVRAELPF